MVNIVVKNDHGATNVDVLVKRNNNTQVGYDSVSTQTGATQSHTFFFFDTPSKGNNSYQIQIGNGWYNGGPWIIARLRVILLGMKR